MINVLLISLISYPQSSSGASLQHNPNSGNLVHQQHHQNHLENYNSHNQQQQQLNSVYPVYPQKVYHHPQYPHQINQKQDFLLDKNEDRVDIKPLRDFLLEFNEDPTGVATSMLSNLWNFLPQYTDVEIRKNFNKLKSDFDAAHFMSRDTVVWLGGSLMWVVLHLIFWDGRVNSREDLEASIQSPGIRIELPSHADLANGVTQPDTSDDAKGNTFLETIEPERLWNFFTSPDTSTRRLYTNVFFGIASHLLWILPTFIGKVPLPDANRRVDVGGTASFDDVAEKFQETKSGSYHQDVADDRILTALADNLATAPIAKNWNRLMSLQGVFANIGINFLNYFGKWLFWSLATRNII